MPEATAPSATPAADAAPNPDAKGLLDDAKPTPDAPTQKNPNASDIPHLLADDPAVKAAELTQKRERPTYIPEKFWDKEKSELLTEQAMKSYAEMEKNFKLGKHKPPADGKYDLTPIADKIPADDPMLTEYTAWAGKHGLSQSAFEELAGKVVEMAGGAANEVKLSQKAEMEKLGEQGPAIINSMVDWAQKFVSSGVWTAEDFDEFKVMGGTAAGMRSLMRLRESYEGRVPLKETIPNDVGVSDEELDAMVGDKRYKTNEGGFRDKTEKMFEKRYGGQRVA